MICKADTVGVFQIESRAQMSMLPRLRPRCFYDLVIEVAIVRPGPIVGQMVHPYLRRRNGEEPVTYPDAKVERILKKTLGVPLFQEQAMSLAIVAAGFTPGEADRLRRAIAAWKRRENVIFQFGAKLIAGMLANGYQRDFAEQCFQQIQGFSEYGFPESHAASFALLAYVSAWLKHHHPAAFAAALINSQPMGFYAPAQIIRDAQEHGVEVRPVDVNCSQWDCTLEGSDGAMERRSDEGKEERHEGTEIQRHEEKEGRQEGTVCRPFSGEPTGPRGAANDLHEPRSHPAIRLGLRLIKGLKAPHAHAIAAAVARHGPFRSIESLWRASGVPASTMRRLARADAFQSMQLDRQAALWHVRALHDESLPIFDQPTIIEHAESTEPLVLPAIPEPRKVVQDYAATGLSLKAHPLAFIRTQLNARHVTPNAHLKDEARCPHGARIAVAGVVLVRQRPSTASGIVFMTIEDETGVANLIVRPRVFEKFRRAARHGIAILVHGQVERQGQVVHLMARRIDDISPLITDLLARSRDFH